MIGTMIRASLRRNRVVSALMAGFLVLSTTLLASATILAFAVFGSVTGFMETARTPHFMQMHLGELDTDRLEGFAASRPEVAAFEVIDILNVDNSALAFAGNSLDTEIQQNSFVRQPERMDFLLAEDGTRVEPEAGQVWVPFFYQDKYDLRPGDVITVQQPDGSTTLTVAGAFRDSQMNSTLASSKRLLVSDADYQRIAGLAGATSEHLISFRTHSSSDASALETAYHAAGLEANGPALTWDLFVVVNSINDAITVLLFTLMAVIVLLISLLCIRYTLLTTIEEDLREIGVMKALGVGDSRIRQIYLGKYRVLLGAGTVLGCALALAGRAAILANVRRQLGEVNFPVLGVLAGLAGAALLYLAAMGYVRRVLTRIRKIPALQAMRGSSGLAPKRVRPRPVVPSATGPAVNRRLAFARIRRDPSRHLTIAAVAFLVTVVLLVPFRFLATMSASSFVGYMGMGSYDLRVDLLNRPDAPQLAARLQTALQEDDRVRQVELYTLETESVLTEDGGSQPMRVDYGDPSAFPLHYAQGRAPRTTSEIALSQLNAERLTVQPGGELRLRTGDNATTFTVTGVYQDITNGGKTAKALPGPTMDATSPGVMLAASAADPAAVATSLSEAHPGVDVIETAGYVQQMLGDLIRVMGVIAWVFAGVGVLVAALIAGISIRLMLVTERRETAVLGALGFTSARLRVQYLLRVMTMLAVGVLVGVALAGPLGDVVAGMVFGTVGLSGISLAFSPLPTLLGCALVLLAGWAVSAAHTRSDFNAGLAARLRA